MLTRSYENKASNPGQLCDELIAAGATHVCGASYNCMDVHTDVFIRDVTPQAELDAIDATVASHVSPSLNEIKVLKIYVMRAAVQAYLFTRYDQGCQASLNGYFIEAVLNDWTNRIALIKSVLDWINSVLSSYYTHKENINAASDIAGVKAETWDFYGFTASDPAVSLQTVKEMTN